MPLKAPGKKKKLYLTVATGILPVLSRKKKDNFSYFSFTTQPARVQMLIYTEVYCPYQLQFDIFSIFLKKLGEPTYLRLWGK